MKLLTIVIPCYNSEAYMAKAIECAVSGGEEIDVLVVDDGSRDGTAAIADDYAARYPSIVRVIHQENGGHGEGLNQGIRTALGLYFKVLDSDDRIDKDLLPGLLDILRAHTAPDQLLDLVVHDYVYDTNDKQSYFRISYRMALRPNRDLTWDTVGHFPMASQFMIHCLVYRTQMLRDMKLELPKHVFYEDNLYIYRPLPYVKKLAYYNKPLHGYFIGRADQSVNEANVIKRLPQYTDMIVQMACSYTWQQLSELPKHLREYMINNVAGQLLTLCSLQFIAGDEGLKLYQEMQQRICDFDPVLWDKIRRNFLGRISTPSTKAGRDFMVFWYRFVRRFMHF